MSNTNILKSGVISLRDMWVVKCIVGEKSGEEKR